MHGTGTDRRVRRGRRWVLIAAALADIAAMSLAGFAWSSAAIDADASALRGSPAPSVVIGIPGGVAYLPSSDQSPVASAAEDSPSGAPLRTPEPTAEPSPIGAPPTAAPPTGAPSSAAPATAAPPTAAPTTEPVAAAPASAPDASVAAFYRYAEAQDFDAAYALWSQRMRSQFPRQANLDNRFDQTAEISIGEIYVAELATDAAKVQVNFVETYTTGSSREFIGWWELILVDGRWTLDQPHF